MKSLRIAMVGYLNTLPFEYGLKRLSRSEPLQLILDTPAQCAALFAENKADLALVPVGALDSLPPHDIVLDYCIGCHGAVRTVGLFSHVPPAAWKKVWLDTHSRTSRLLAQIIIRDHMGLTVDFADLRISQMSPLAEGEAALMIGDKVFDREQSYKYKVDLGAAWEEMTGLPFAFAVWVKRRDVHLDTALINQALANGLEKIPDLVRVHAETAGLTSDAVATYINDDLKYEFGAPQRKALQYFRYLVAEGNWV